MSMKDIQKICEEILRAQEGAESFKEATTEVSAANVVYVDFRRRERKTV